jgi:hypothetical protein
MEAWRAANDHIRDLEASEMGFANGAAVGALSAELKPLAESALTDPLVQRTYALAPIEVAMVELDWLVLFQKHINLAYAGELRKLVEVATGDSDIFRFAIRTTKGTTRRSSSDRRPATAGSSNPSQTTFGCSVPRCSTRRKSSA